MTAAAEPEEGERDDTPGGSGALRVGVVVPAAGLGQRMGGLRKPFLDLAGEPILAHALRPFLAERRVAAVVVVLAPDDAVDPPAWIEELDPRVEVVPGGRTRGESVARGIEALPDDVHVIAVHDAARPLVLPDVIRRCVDTAAYGVAAVAGCPAVDTMKVVDEGAYVRSSPDRSTLWHAHTPQVFPSELLRRAYAAGDGGATDDASLVERFGGRIRMVDDGDSNPKVTRPSDLPVAEAILRAREET